MTEQSIRDVVLILQEMKDDKWNTVGDKCKLDYLWLWLK